MQKELEQFLTEANQAGYASGEERKWDEEKDGSTTITFELGPWRMHDNFVGGSPYAGRELVYLENKPYWILLYWGEVLGNWSPSNVYRKLQRALAQPPREIPYVRGPENYRQEGFSYFNSFNGDLDQFNGQEQILIRGTKVYQATYFGGLVDQR